jgi:5-methylcytosine-specific restriction endonuclease McrA
VSTKRKKKATAKQLYQLIEEQEFRCSLSGMKLTPKIARLDHKVPVSKGGDDSVDNLQWVHEEINRMKGTMDNLEFLELCKRIVAWDR